MTTNDLLNAFKLARSGDDWGDCMSAFFSVASELHNRGDAMPDAWKFRPGACNPQEVDEFWQVEFARASSATLVEFGDILNRLSRILRAQGKDY